MNPKWDRDLAKDITKVINDQARIVLKGSPDGNYFTESTKLGRPLQSDLAALDIELDLFDACHKMFILLSERREVIRQQPQSKSIPIFAFDYRRWIEILENHPNTNVSEVSIAKLIWKDDPSQWPDPVVFQDWVRKPCPERDPGYHQTLP